MAGAIRMAENMMRAANAVERPACRLHFPYQVGALHRVYYVYSYRRRQDACGSLRMAQDKLASLRRRAAVAMSQLSQLSQGIDDQLSPFRFIGKTFADFRPAQKLAHASISARRLSSASERR